MFPTMLLLTVTSTRRKIWKAVDWEKSVSDNSHSMSFLLVQGLDDLEITGRMETIQTTALLRSARTLRRALET